MRPIDADALKEWIDEYVSVFKKSDNKDIKGYIEHQPTIEPKRGEWIPCTKSGLALTELMRREGQKWYGYRCSNCNHIYKGNALTDCNFCPNCGARMKGADDFVKTHEVVVNGNCAICGKPLNGTKLFLCEGCSEKGADDDTD